MSKPSEFDMKTMKKGFRRVALAILLMFVGPIIINTSFKNQLHPFSSFVLSIGVSICLFSMLWFFLGVRGIVQGIFNDKNISK